MINADLPAISSDIAQRLTARQNGLKLRVLGDKTFASEATVWVYVDIVDGAGKNALDIIRLFESVEQETSKRFNVDVMILSELPE